MFERLNIPNIYFLKNPVLSCFATGIFYCLIIGRSTALVCDSGDTYTRFVAVHDGYCLYKSSRSIAYAGSTITNSIRKLVEKSTGGIVPIRFSSSCLGFRQFQEDEVLRDIKHSFSTRQT